MLRALTRPAALVSHLLVLTVVVVCVLLGQWQLDRLATIRAENARFAERLAQPPVDLAGLADPASAADVDASELEFRRVEVVGSYRPEQEVLQRNRTYRNQTGFHVLTPLELADGGLVLVRRGWVPTDLDEPPVREAAPPSGEVTVVGVLERPVEQPTFGARDPDEGELDRVFHTDTARLDAQIDGTLFPMVLRIDEELANPTRDELPFPVGSPELDERNHLSYAVQWHAFALIASISYAAWWFTRLRRTTVWAPDDAEGEDDDPPSGGGGGGLDRDPEPDRPLAGASR